MATLADVLVKTDEEEIYQAAAWVDMRSKYQEYKYWYKGEEWEKYVPDIRDQVTGDRVRQWPLRLNPISKVCRIHRAFLMGMQEEAVTGLPVQTLVIRDDTFTDEQKVSATHLQRLIEKVWRSSNGVASQYEAGLLMQIYGGHVFKVAWCPWEANWPYRIGVQSFKTPAVFYPSVYSAFDHWLLYEAYIGYMIKTSDAKEIYGITPPTDKDEVLYLEHWTRDSYKFTVDGTVPVMTWNEKKFKLEGKNPWGVIPIVYIPHDPDGDYYGRSMVEGGDSLVGLAKELNARMADKGEFVQDSRPMMVGRNLRSSGSLQLRDVRYQGNVSFQILDIGDAPPMPGSREPDLFVVQSSGMPKEEAAYPEQILADIRRQGDVASAASGDDDVSGGRITGPVTAYRMWPTMQHTMAERAYWTVGLGHIARIIARIAQVQEAAGVYDELGISPPGITEEMMGLDYGAAWRQMIPIEEHKALENLNQRLTAGGVSLYSYLSELQVQDVQAEVERIWEDRKRQAEVDAIVERAKGEAMNSQREERSHSEK